MWFFFSFFLTLSSSVALFVNFFFLFGVFSWTLHFRGQWWARIMEGIPAVFLRLQPERISERIVEQIVGCSISRRIEPFIAT